MMLLKDQAAELCDRARNGDFAAGSELAALFYQRIFAYLRRLCPNEQDAADLTQKTFSNAWGSLASFEGRSSFSTWLHGIAYHVYLDWRRSANPAQAQTEEWWRSRTADEPGPDEDAAAREAAEQLYAWVEQLADDQKHVVHLHYYQDLSLSETAEALGIATSTVKYRLREAMEVLRSKATLRTLVTERRLS